MLTAKQAFNLAQRLLDKGWDVDRAERYDNEHWRVSVRLPSMNFWIITEPIARVSAPEVEEE